MLTRDRRHEEWGNRYRLGVLQWRRQPWLRLAAVMVVVAATAAAVPFVTGESGSAQAVVACTGEGASWQGAVNEYEDNCSTPRRDCDPVGNGWLCSSEQIGADAPGGTVVVDVDDDDGDDDDNTAGPCYAIAATLADAGKAYADKCDAPRVDCDPKDRQWICADVKMINGELPSSPPGGPTTSTPRQTTTTTSTPTSTVTTGTPTTATPTTVASEVCDVVILEAEDLPLNGSWNRKSDSRASGGQYITWEGLSFERNNYSPDDVVTTDVQIGKPGTYRFTWSMRQPDGVELDKANDTWLNFPDADRFGPVGGGSYPGFVKVYGNSKGDFKYAAKADVNHKHTDIAVEFASSGTYKMQIAGRSHGHQLDRIVIRHQSVGFADAIAGKRACANGGGGSAATTTTFATTTTTASAPTTTTAGGGSSPTGMFGRFDRGEDILLCNFDSKPDEDDLHAVAGLATMLRDTRISGIDYHCTAGAYGTQGGTFLDEPKLFDLAFGSTGWASAHADRTRAVNIAADKAVAALDRGGDVWVTEAGQSDVTARIVKRIKSLRGNVNTRDRVHVVQHSDWNEDKTTNADLSYVRGNTQYNKIGDGNSANNGTPQLKTGSGQYWARATGDAAVGAIWAEADAAADRGMRVDWNNESIKGGGMDFSDTVEVMYVFGFEKRGGNVAGFFDEFLGS